jgi:uncharacterized protein (DUF1684 family)
VSFTLLDWRRRVSSLYAEIRRTSEPSLAHELWRTARDDLLRNHPDSPIPVGERVRFTGVPVAPYRSEFRFEVEVDMDVPSASFEFETGTDGLVPFKRIGLVRLPDIGALDVWWLSSYGGGMFVPIKDTLAGTKTYGGGRYLIDTVKGADLGGNDGRLVIDLNFAYNPSCAYDPRWACPLAPPGNVVPTSVPVGELMPE